MRYLFKVMNEHKKQDYTFRTFLKIIEKVYSNSSTTKKVQS